MIDGKDAKESFRLLNILFDLQSLGFSNPPIPKDIGEFILYRYELSKFYRGKLGEAIRYEP